MALILKAYWLTCKFLKNRPIILLPFALYSCVEILGLSLLFLAPRFPFNLFLGPPIRTFWGDRFLHYPYNFLLLPKLSSLNKLVLYTVFGSFFLGIAVSLLNDIYSNKKHVKLFDSLINSAKKYVSLFAAILFITLLFYFSIKIPHFFLMKYFTSGHSKLLFLPAGFWLGWIEVIINFLIGILLQSMFIYMVPFLIIDKEKLIAAILKSALLFKKLFLPTLILVTLPSMIYIPFIIVSYNTPFLINNAFPEIIFIILLLGILVNSFVVDSIMTISSTVLFLLNKEQGTKK